MVMKNAFSGKFKWFVLAVVFLRWPFFVLAGSCWVDKGAEHGDGSKKSPYGSIGEALSYHCREIKVKDGQYSEKVVLPKNVKLKGESHKTVIKELVMKNGSEAENLAVKGGGVEITKDARAELLNVEISGAHIGIKTSGRGKLIVRDSEINGNGKGFYLQYGKDVDIRGNEVTNNEEEGIDIRANVDGVIENNQISNNKEGGIEVVAGKSDLTIRNNIIKNNKASGIAIQFYKSIKDLGALIIAGNVLSGNGNYGIDCKIPSGGKPSAGYWSQSVVFGYNRIEGNGKGILSKSCGFSKEEFLRATKTEEELEKMEKEEKAREEQASKDEEQAGEVDVAEQQRLQQREKDWETKIDLEDKLETVIETLRKREKEEFEQIKKQSFWQMFLWGPEEDALRNLEEELAEHRRSLEYIQKKLAEMKTEDLKGVLQSQWEEEQKIYENNLKLFRFYKRRFALIPWFKKLFGR